MTMERFEYPVALKRSREGGFVVTARDLPALVTQGDDRADALAQASDAMDETIATLMKLGRDLPTASVPRRGEFLVSPPAESVAKAALYVLVRRSKITKVELAHRLGIDEKEVRRLLDPLYLSKLPRIVEAVALLGGRLVLGLEPLAIAAARAKPRQDATARRGLSHGAGGKRRGKGKIKPGSVPASPAAD